MILNGTQRLTEHSRTIENFREPSMDGKTTMEGLCVWLFVRCGRMGTGFYRLTGGRQYIYDGTIKV